MSPLVAGVLPSWMVLLPLAILIALMVWLFVSGNREHTDHRSMNTRLTAGEIAMLEEALNSVDMYRYDGNGWVSVHDRLAEAVEHIIDGRLVVSDECCE